MGGRNDKMIIYGIQNDVTKIYKTLLLLLLLL